MSNTVILVGATGDLGTLVLHHLRRLGGQVRCLVRRETSSDSRALLQREGAEVREVDFLSIESLASGCVGGAAVVSTVSGLREVIVDFQTRLLRAAVSAEVPRFIPSDFSIDYRRIPTIHNRNLSLREEFRRIIDAEPAIRATSILNGAFSDMLTGVAPFILFPIRRILCWGDANQLMDWTTINDAAQFTAYAALDKETPRFLFIAGDQVCASSLATAMTDLTRKPHKVLKPGGLGTLGFLINMTRVFVSGATDVYPPWQGMQYMHNMYSGIGKFQHLDNARYPVQFSSVRDILSKFLAGRIERYVPGARRH